MQSNSEEQAAEEGRQREEVLCSFKKIGVAEIVLCTCLFLFGIITTIIAATGHSWFYQFSLVSSGVWCSLLSLPAGIMSVVTASKVSYFNIGWSFILFIIGSLFLFLHLCLTLVAAIESASFFPDVVCAFNIILLICGLASFTLYLYQVVVFGRMFINYPHHVVEGNGLCPCCNFSRHERNSFAHVMYTNLAPKKHDH